MLAFDLDCVFKEFKKDFKYMVQSLAALDSLPVMRHGSSFDLPQYAVR